MRYLIILFWLFLCPALFPATVQADDVKTLETVNKRLRAELELATRQQIYFMFDLQQGIVQFKSSGISVAELPLHSVRPWGQIATDKVRTVASKHSFVTPEREVLKVPSPEESAKTEAKPESEPKKFELAALELPDMPTSYKLRFDDGLLITVRPDSEGFISRLWRTLDKGFWYLSRPLLTLWHYFHKQNYCEILLTMPPKDAQLLYWSLTEGASCLIVD